MKRFVIILLALLSGLSVPQAVAAAAGRIDSGVVATRGADCLAAVSEEARHCQLQPRRTIVPARASVPVLLPALSGGRPIHFGDRARE